MGFLDLAEATNKAWGSTVHWTFRPQKGYSCLVGCCCPQISASVMELKNTMQVWIS